MQHLRNVGQGVDRSLVAIGSDSDQQGIVSLRDLLKAIIDFDMRRSGTFQIIRASVTNVKQQGGWLLIDKSSDGSVAFGCLPTPIELAGQGVERPKLRIVALRGDDGLCSQIMGQVTCQLVGSTDMAREH